uniref:Uncharacterized protein n=1 Tax=Oryza nivara TaxID=4536 RepID=A0A0E0FWC1_ORYNI
MENCLRSTGARNQQGCSSYKATHPPSRVPFLLPCGASNSTRWLGKKFRDILESLAINGK